MKTSLKAMSTLSKSPIKKWNDASFFVDFTDKNPRTFRLGVFSDYQFWNPRDRKWDDIPDADRPLVSVTSPPFARDKWTHVAFVFSKLNQSSSEGVTHFFLDGELQGSLRGQQRISWQSERVSIWLGINYVGWMDDLMVFDRALSKAELRALARPR